MKPFLQKLAEEIATRYNDDPGGVCVVLPNRRAGLYLKKYLAELLKKPAWAPHTVSIEDFITDLSGFRLMDPAGLLFELYRIHKESQGEKAQDFEQFTDWGQVLLQDFNEIDQYLVDPDEIFNYLNAARALTVWNLNEKPLTEQELRYLEFYRSFLHYYRELNKALKEKKHVYQGLAFRITAENIERLASGTRYRKIFFAGLNALSAAEEKIIGHLLNQGLAEIFWDADEYYIRDTNQEAGEFIRRYLQKWPADPVKWIGEEFRSKTKKISVFGIPGSTGQAQKASSIVNRLKDSATSPDKTALVLADEKLLLPVLYALPEELGPVNITMGYPFRLTHLYHLINNLFQAQLNAVKFAAQRNGTARSFYIKDILQLLSHPYLSLFGPGIQAGQRTFDQMRSELNKKNRVFFSPGELLWYTERADNEFKELNVNLFGIWDDPSQALERVLNIMALVRDRMIAGHAENPGEFEPDLEYLYFLSRIIRKIRNLLDTYPYINDLKTLKKILFRLLDSSSMPFSGEPLHGLQVMGVLETRAIDFENLIVLSVNEGILPSGRLPNSLIPFDIKNKFGLPTFQHKDAVFAYHFYRMLQRAENIFLLYDTEGDQMKGGEKSRFIMQLGYELKQYNPEISYNETLLRPNPPASGLQKEITVTKDPVIMARLMEKAVKGLSPSAFNLYINCPLSFYFQEILGLAEAESVEETIEAKTVGTAVHQAFYMIYEPFTGKYADAMALEKAIPLVEGYMLDAFREHYQEGDLQHGKNHLVFKASLFLAAKFIRHETEQLRKAGASSPLKIISLEQSHDRLIQYEVAGRKTDVKIKGKIDRIDQWDGVTRIIDYKTGSVQAADLNLKAWEELAREPRMAKVFQLLTYAWLYYKNHAKTGETIQTGNITLRRISAGFMKVKLPGGQEIGAESIAIFEDILLELVGTIMDPEVPFRQAEKVEQCRYCPFTSICNR